MTDPTSSSAAVPPAARSLPPVRVLATTPTGETTVEEAATIALYGWDEAAAARDTARVLGEGGGEVHLDCYPARREPSGDDAAPGEQLPAGSARGTVVFVGGLSNHALGYADFQYRLSLRGWNVVALDVRGHGRSGGRRGDFTTEMLLEDIAIAVAYARERFGVEQVGLMGTSMGGYYALIGANAVDGIACAVSHWIFLPNRPMARRDAIMKPVALLLDRIAPRLGIPTRSIGNWDAVNEDPELRQRTYDDPMMVWKYSARALASGFRYRPQRPLTELRVPHLVVIGERDEMTNMDYTRRVYDELRGDKEWVTIANAGHMGGLVEHQDEMLDAVDDFLSRRLASVPGAATRVAAGSSS